MNRRAFVVQGAAVMAAAKVGFGEAVSALPAWAAGVMEIHHIATARGNCTLLLLPDGTTMMVDAGAIYGDTPYLEKARPSDARRPGEWCGRYAQRRLKAAGLNGIDVFLLTHHHGDHMGFVPEGATPNAKGYVPTGVSDVDAVVPIARVVDRDWPGFDYPTVEAEASLGLPLKNYRAFLEAKRDAGGVVERFRAGAKDQFVLRHAAAKYPEFEVRNLAVNGEVWTGEGDATEKRFPAIAELKPGDYPSENMCSAAVRLRYGKFGYYTGGDLPNATKYGALPWWDIETPVAKVCGPVSVAVTNHHGYFNADGPEWMRALEPSVVVLCTWDSAHPTVNTMDVLTSREIVSKPHDVFATYLNAANHLANKKTDAMKSANGHVVVRVEPGGGSFRVFVLSNADEGDRVTGVFGPYAS